MEARFSVAGQLRHWAEAAPDAPLVVAGDRTLTWSQTMARAGSVASALVGEGVEPGDRLAFLDRNGIGHLETMYGCALAGAVHVALNWRLAPGEIAATLADARPRILVVAEDLVAPCREVLGAASSLGIERVVVLEGGGVPLPRGAVAYEDWLADHRAADPGHDPAPDEPVLELYTSGTTGRPKGVLLSNANLALAVEHVGAALGMAPDTVSLVAMPLSHIAGVGWALCGASRGGRLVMVRDLVPSVVLDAVARHRVTDTFVAPAVLASLLAAPAIATADLSSLRTVFYGASPISEDLLERCLGRFGCRFVQIYGLTETTGVATMLAPEDHDPGGPRRHLLRSAGRPLPNVELRVVDPDDGEPLPPGRIGEVQVRSPYAMLGYFAKPEETAATIDPEGWLRTGDAGYLDADGYLYLYDRITDMIVTGAENVYPAEVENVLLSHPGVADVTVIGVPDDHWGETVKAVVVPVSPASASASAGAGAGADGPALADELIAYCRARLAHFKCPTSVDLVEVLPRNHTGKVLRRAVREPYWRGRDRRVG